MRKPPDYCPNCGAEVPPDARACPQCGSDENTGWSDNAAAGGLDLPEENFNYEEFVREEFGAPASTPRGISRFWWFVAILIAIAFILGFVL